MKWTLFTILLFVVSQPALAWSERGHHIIAVLAYEELTRSQQAEIIRLIKAHPRFEQDFKIPEGIKNKEHWLVGRAGYWPDVARRTPEWNRPTWHYELGASAVIGDVEPPADPGPLPDDATLETQELYASQAFELCRRILLDGKQADADRAVALCWVLHGVADLHQPCHTGSLYAEGVFDEGDRGANSIKTVQSGNLHALWDGLLGRNFDEGDVNRWIRDQRNELAKLREAMGEFTQALGGRRERWDETAWIDVNEWISEGRQLASIVYPYELRREIRAYGKNNTPLPKQDMKSYLVSAEYTDYFGAEAHYLQLAGAVARVRAHMAGKRLGLVIGATKVELYGGWAVKRLTVGGKPGAPAMLGDVYDCIEIRDGSVAIYGRSFNRRSWVRTKFEVVGKTQKNGRRFWLLRDPDDRSPQKAIFTLNHANSLELQLIGPDSSGVSNNLTFRLARLPPERYEALQDVWHKLPD
ncbi:MAG TPA: hypothetical protein DDW52_24145 [Planctomycetaceae bacterium]|nr:hypothetical protein [Planctomycetaceae bacterium]